MDENMEKHTPKVSVITATYNDKENLRRIIRQVSSQSYENIEYIIVDGGSSDGTLEVIREAEKQFGERLKWISEPDKGIYDALNKGIRMASGDILGCCFDEYSGPDVIAKMVDIMEREQTDGVHGSVLAGCRDIRLCIFGKASTTDSGFIRQITGFRQIMNL